MRSGRRAGLRLAGLVIAVSYLKPAAQLPANPCGQWLSWTASEKNAYSRWFHRRAPQRHDRDSPSRWPLLNGGKVCSSGDRRETRWSASAACFASGGNYSQRYPGKAGLDFSVYANIIAGSCSKHPDDRAVSFRRLIVSLRDGACSGEGQLYQEALRGDVRKRPCRTITKKKRRHAPACSL